MDENVKLPPPKTAWTRERVARLGFLAGLGYSAEQIAKDPLIASKTNNVNRVILRFGLSLREAKSRIFSLPQCRAIIFDAEAEKRGLTREGLFKRIIGILAADPTLLANILDDQDDAVG